MARSAMTLAILFSAMLLLWPAAGSRVLRQQEASLDFASSELRTNHPLAFGYKPCMQGPTFVCKTMDLFKFDIKEDVQRIYTIRKRSALYNSVVHTRGIKDLAKQMSQSAGAFGSMPDQFWINAFTAPAFFEAITSGPVKTNNQLRIETQKTTLKWELMMETVPEISLFTKDILLNSPPEEIYNTLGGFYAQSLTLGVQVKDVYTKELHSGDNMSSIQAEMHDAIGPRNERLEFNPSKKRLDDASVAHTGPFSYPGGYTERMKAKQAGFSGETSPTWSYESIDDHETLVPINWNLIPIWKLLQGPTMNKAKAQAVERYIKDKWATEAANIDGLLLR